MTDTESGTIVKVVIGLGIILLVMATVSNPTYISDPVPEDSAWGQFSNTIQDFPVFVNPFETRGYAANAPLEEQAFYWQFPTTNNVTNFCTNITYYECVDEEVPDFDDTFVTWRNFDNPDEFDIGLPGYITFGVSGIGFDWTRIDAFNVNMWCRWDNTPDNSNVTVSVELFEAVGPFVISSIHNPVLEDCASGSVFERQEFSLASIPGTPSNANADMQLRVFGEGNGDYALDISTIILTVYFAGDPTCTGAGFFGDLSCQFANFFRPVVNFIGLIVGAFIFVGSVLFWFGSMISAFVSLFAPLFAVDGIPPFAQGFITLILIAFIATITIFLLSKIRGSGTVG